jgi:uncharacterized membrane protein
VIGGIVALIILLLHSKRTEMSPTWRGEYGRPTPFDILRERFARGEIDQQEYENVKDCCRNPDPEREAITYVP